MKDSKKVAWFIAFIIVFFLLIWLFQAVWNEVVPEVFPGIRTVTYIQAVAIIFLASMLFSPVVMVNCNNKDSDENKE